MTEKLKKCPFCGRKLVRTTNAYINSFGKEVKEDFYSHDVVQYPEYCPAEEIIIGNNVKDIAAWNTRAADENPPLTLDELQKMYRNPIWIQGSEQRFSGWAIVGATFDDYDKQVARCADGLNISHYMKDYGKTWLAYKRKPEAPDE